MQHRQSVVVVPFDDDDDDHDDHDGGDNQKSKKMVIDVDVLSARREHRRQSQRRLSVLLLHQPQDSTHDVIKQCDETETTIVLTDSDDDSALSTTNDSSVVVSATYKKELSIVLNLVMFYILSNCTVKARPCLPRAVRYELVTHRRHIGAEIVEYVPSPTKPARETLALKEQCDNLTTLTTILSKRLVETTLQNKQRKVQTRRDSVWYRTMMQQLEQQHKLEVERLASDCQFFQQQLRRYKTESVPPVVRTKTVSFSPETAINRSIQRRRRLCRKNRHSFMDTFLTSCYGSKHQQQPQDESVHASFTMISSMLLQNRVLPAMLSAVVRAHEPKP